MLKKIIIYRTRNDKDPFVEWLLAQKDRITRERIQSKIRRIESGNFRDYKRFLGILEIKLDFGKGYRLYCGESRNTLIVLLVGGDKSTQDRDIRKALKYWEDYHEQNENEDF